MVLSLDILAKGNWLGHATFAVGNYPNQQGRIAKHCPVSKPFSVEKVSNPLWLDSVPTNELKIMKEIFDEADEKSNRR